MLDYIPPRPRLSNRLVAVVSFILQLNAKAAIIIKVVEVDNNRTFNLRTISRIVNCILIFPASTVLPVERTAMQMHHGLDVDDVGAYVANDGVRKTMEVELAVVTPHF